MSEITPKFNGVIARRLIVAVILFSAVITVISTSIQLYGDYKADVGEIYSHLEEIGNVHLASISRSVWVADYRNVKNIIEGVRQLPSIEFVEVYEESRQIADVGQAQTSNYIERQYPLEYIYKDQIRHIGYVRVQATLNAVYRSLLNKAFFILIGNGIKTFLVSSLILFLIYYLVTRHLQTLSQYAGRLNLNNLEHPLQLERSEDHKPDELDVVVDAINLMRRNLMQSITVLRESAQRYRSLIETTTAIPWEYSLETNSFTYVGPQAVNVLGYPLENWQHAEFRERHIHPEDKVDTLRAFKKIIEETKEGEIEYRFADVDGRFVDIREHIKVIEVEGAQKSVSGFMFDITKKNAEKKELADYRNNLENLVKQRTQELEIINNELEAFCYSVSHDLRAPLRAIFGFSQALQEDFSGKLNELGVDYLERVQKASLRMGYIIDDLLRLSRITRKQLKVESLDLGDLANIALEQLELIYEGEAPQLVFEGQIMARGDRGLLSVVLENLISNAWKYMDPGKGAVITIGSQQQDGETVYFVADNGMGFDMRYYEKLFAAFQRLHNNEKFEGSGIGLATVQRIIQRHGGRIWAESTVDVGSTFYFTLHAEQAQSEEQENIDQSEQIAN